MLYKILMKCTPDPHENKQPASKDIFLLHGVIYKTRKENYYKMLQKHFLCKM